MAGQSEGDNDRRCQVKFRIEWAMWGNMNALYAAVILFVGAIVGATVELINFDSTPIHSYGTVTRWICIPLSMLIFVVEYPRSKRRAKPDGSAHKNVERPAQQYIAPFIHYTGFVGRNYIFRFIMYLLAIVPCIFVLSTIMGGMCLFFAAACYFIAAISGEEWIAPSLAFGGGEKYKKKEKPSGHSLPAPPTTIAPRLDPEVARRQAPSQPPPSRPPPRLEEQAGEY